jgi:hypothetical protein
MGNWLCANPPNRPNQIIITLRGEPERILHNIQSPIKPVCARKTYQKELQTDCNKMDRFFNVSPDIQTDISDIHKMQTDDFLNVTLPDNTKHPLSVNEN